MKFQWPSITPLVFNPSVGHIKPKTSKTITVTFKTTKPQALRAHKIVAKTWKISFSKPHSQIPDWDDRMKSVQWVTMALPPPLPAATGLENASLNSIPLTSSTTSKHHTPPAKKKVVETEKEPAHHVVDDTYRDIELSVTGTADYCRYECPVQDIKFRDTLMYQTRAYSFLLKNTGKIELIYQWAVLGRVDSYRSSLQERAGSSATTDVVRKEPPFSVSPVSGTILPDREMEFTVRFSPLHVVDAHYLIHCQ